MSATTPSEPRSVGGYTVVTDSGLVVIETLAAHHKGQAVVRADQRERGSKPDVGQKSPPEELTLHRRSVAAVGP